LFEGKGLVAFLIVNLHIVQDVKKKRLFILLQRKIPCSLLKYLLIIKLRLNNLFTAVSNGTEQTKIKQFFPLLHIDTHSILFTFSGDLKAKEKFLNLQRGNQDKAKDEFIKKCEFASSQSFCKNRKETKG